MALSRIEAQDFFKYLGLNLDNKEVKCFKCGNPLYYQSNITKYRCLKNHTYSYQDTVFKFALYLQDLQKEVSDSHTCGVQMQN